MDKIPGKMVSQPLRGFTFSKERQWECEFCMDWANGLSVMWEDVAMFKDIL